MHRSAGFGCTALCSHIRPSRVPCSSPARLCISGIRITSSGAAASSDARPRNRPCSSSNSPQLKHCGAAWREEERKGAQERTLSARRMCARALDSLNTPTEGPYTRTRRNIAVRILLHGARRRTAFTLCGSAASARR
eukprot:3170703-Prymnesium_polylepis.1